MNPQWHPDARALSFNVKTLCYVGRWAEGGTDEQRDDAWEEATRLWWDDAKRIAQQHGFDDIEQHGRSGGWLTPVPGIEPDDPDAGEMHRLTEFSIALDAHFNDAPDYFAQSLACAIANDVEEGDTDPLAALLTAVREYVKTGHGIQTYRAIAAALAGYEAQA